MKTIAVTARHIRLGRYHRTSNTLCPVARALHAAGLKKAQVGVSTAWTEYDVSTGKFTGLIALPKAAFNFIENKLIRDPKSMKPFKFKLTDKQVAALRGK